MSAFTHGPVVILTPADARILWQAARLGDLRVKHRGDPRLYDVLLNIYKGTLLEDAARGNDPRQIAETEDREYWNTTQVARAAGYRNAQCETTAQTTRSPQSTPTKTGRG